MRRARARGRGGRVGRRPVDRARDGRARWSQVSFEKPADAFQKGVLDDGSPYLWRQALDSRGRPKSEIQMWTPAVLNDGTRYWWKLAVDGRSPEVTLKDPFKDVAPDALHPEHDELHFVHDNERDDLPRARHGSRDEL